MQSISKFASLFLFPLVFLVLTVTHAEAGTIKTEKQFRETVVGKRLVSGDAWVLITADGKFSGVSRQNEKVRGAWIWHDKYWCRNVLVGTQKWQQDCQVIKVEGSKLTIIREKGKGLKTEWTIQ